MKHYTEFTGKTVDEAIEEGLRELGLNEEDADVRVLDTGKKKLFGYTKARVEIAPKNDSDAFEGGQDEETVPYPTEEKGSEENTAESGYEGENKEDIHRDETGRTDGERAVDFIEGLFDIMRVTACTELVHEGEKIEINVTAAKTDSIIGKHGAMLDAIQTLAGAVANTGRTDYKRVVVDCENYRENRDATLERLANSLARKALRMEKKLRLEPMTPYERRIIHAALANNPDVTTESEGKEPHRYVVVVPCNVRYPDRPATPVSFTRGERNDRNYGGRGYGNRNYGNRGYNRDRYNDGYRDDRGDRGYNRDRYGDRNYNSRGYNRYNDGYKDNYEERNDRGYNRDRYGDRDRSGYNNRYNDRNERTGDRGSYERRSDRSDRRGYDNKPYDRNKTSYKKPATDFFGTYLGNSRDSKETSETEDKQE